MTTLEGKIEEAFEKSIPGKVSYCVCYLRVSKALVATFLHIIHTLMNVCSHVTITIVNTQDNLPHKFPKTPL